MTVAEVHEQALATTAFLSRHQVPEPILPVDVIRVLNRERIPLVLVGDYGIAGWLKKARATEEVHIVVPARRLKSAVAVLLQAFPRLEAVRAPLVTHLRKRSNQAVAIEVIRPVMQPYRDVFKHRRLIRTESERYAVPSLEMALVMKFEFMYSIYRRLVDRLQDAHDFVRMVLANPDVKRRKIVEIGRLIYPKAGKDILKTIDRARAGNLPVL